MYSLCSGENPPLGALPAFRSLIAPFSRSSSLQEENEERGAAAVKLTVRPPLRRVLQPFLYSPWPKNFLLPTELDHMFSMLVLES